MAYLECCNTVQVAAEEAELDHGVQRPTNAVSPHYDNVWSY